MITTHEMNVAAQENDPNSILNHFRKMTKVRKANPVLVYGQYEILQREHPTVYAFKRTLEQEQLLVLLNFSDKNATIALPELESATQVVINNYQTLDHSGTKWFYFLSSSDFENGVIIIDIC
ncbi:MAG: alpha-glucosidase C-terminal domain-containing protein [Saprospiraceae bacterium]